MWSVPGATGGGDARRDSIAQGIGWVIVNYELRLAKGI